MLYFVYLPICKHTIARNLSLTRAHRILMSNILQIMIEKIFIEEPSKQFHQIYQSQEEMKLKFIVLLMLIMQVIIYLPLAYRYYHLSQLCTNYMVLKEAEYCQNIDSWI
jgi:hypothetical protein